MKYYTFYPENLKEYDYNYLIELSRCFVSEDGFIDLYNKNMPENIRLKNFDAVTGSYKFELKTEAITRNVRDYNKEKNLITLAWRANPNKAISKNKEIKILKDVDKDIIEDSEAITATIADAITKDGYDKTLEFEKEDIDKTMHFNSGYMLRYFLGAYMPTDESLKKWKASSMSSSLKPTDAQKIMQNVCSNFVERGGNLDFIKLKITNLRNQLTLQKQRDEILKNLSLEEHEKLKNEYKSLKEDITKLDIILNELEVLNSPYDKMLEEVEKDSETDIRELVFEFDRPMLKNVLLCKKELAAEKRRALAIEQGQDQLNPNTPELNTITKISNEIKTIEKESKAESE